MRKINKGEYGYIHKKRKVEIIKTISMFAISLAIFVMGYISTKTKSNMLTIVAVLGCLPASKCAVSMIMFMLAKGCSESVKDRIEMSIGKLDGFYDLFFTSEKKNYAISHLVVTKNSIIAFSEIDKIDENDFANHMKSLLNKEKISDITVKLFKDVEKYCNRLAELNQSEVNQNKRNDIVSMLYQVSL